MATPNAAVQQEIAELVAESAAIHSQFVRAQALRGLRLPTLAEVARDARREWASTAYCRTCRATLGSENGRFHRAAGHDIE